MPSNRVGSTSPDGWHLPGTEAAEVFLERQRAEAFIAEVEQDEPETGALLRAEPIEPGRVQRVDQLAQKGVLDRLG